MEPEDRELAGAAIQAMGRAYAPYSHFHVGAAVRLSDGTIVPGANQENAAYPSGLCAERTAMFAASAAYPDLDMVSIAVAGGASGLLDHIPATPCGACRQVMAQYQHKSGKPMSILLSADRASGNLKKWMIFCRSSLTVFEFLLTLQRESRTRPAPSELPQGRKAARVGGCSGAMY